MSATDTRAQGGYGTMLYTIDTGGQGGGGGGGHQHTSREYYGPGTKTQAPAHAAPHHASGQSAGEKRLDTPAVGSGATGGPAAFAPTSCPAHAGPASTASPATAGAATSGHASADSTITGRTGSRGGAYGTSKKAGWRTIRPGAGGGRGSGSSGGDGGGGAGTADRLVESARYTDTRQESGKIAALLEMTIPPDMRNASMRADFGDRLLGMYRPVEIRFPKPHSFVMLKSYYARRTTPVHNNYSSAVLPSTVQAANAPSLPLKTVDRNAYAELFKPANPRMASNSARFHDEAKRYVRDTIDMWKNDNAISAVIDVPSRSTEDVIIPQIIALNVLKVTASDLVGIRMSGHTHHNMAPYHSPIGDHGVQYGHVVASGSTGKEVLYAGVSDAQMAYMEELHSFYFTREGKGAEAIVKAIRAKDVHSGRAAGALSIDIDSPLFLWILTHMPEIFDKFDGTHGRDKTVPGLTELEVEQVRMISIRAELSTPRADLVGRGDEDSPLTSIVATVYSQKRGTWCLGDGKLFHFPIAFAEVAIAAYAKAIYESITYVDVENFHISARRLTSSGGGTGGTGGTGDGAGISLDERVYATLTMRTFKPHAIHAAYNM